MESWEPWTQRNSSRLSPSSKTRWMCCLISMWVFCLYISSVWVIRSVLGSFSDTAVTHCGVEFLSCSTQKDWSRCPHVCVSFRLMLMNSLMAWSMQPSCFSSRMQFGCLLPTMRASSTSWVKINYYCWLPLTLPSDCWNWAVWLKDQKMITGWRWLGIAHDKPLSQWLKLLCHLLLLCYSFDIAVNIQSLILEVEVKNMKWLSMSSLCFAIDREIFWHEESSVQRGTWYLQEIPHKNDKNLWVPQGCRGKSSKAPVVGVWVNEWEWVCEWVWEWVTLTWSDVFFCCSKWVLTEAISQICLRLVQIQTPWTREQLCINLSLTSLLALLMGLK